MPTILSGTTATPSVPDTHAITLNTKTVTFAGTGNANATLTQMVSTINGVSGTSVVASEFATPNTVLSDSSTAIYGLTGDGYGDLGLNFSDIRALVQQQQTIIGAYEGYYNDTNEVIDKANDSINKVNSEVDSVNSIEPQSTWSKLNPFK